MTRQQRRIIEAAAAISMDRPSDQDKAFLARQLVQTTLPHSNPGNVPVWSRTNGNLTLTIQQGVDDEGKAYGYPYGSVPRLLLYWMATEAVRTKDRHLQLGNSLADFMEEIGLDPNRGGVRSDRARLTNQMTRLLEASIRFTTRYDEGEQQGVGKKRLQVYEEQVLWWDAKNPKQRGLYGSYLLLTESFFDAITSSPVPLDLRGLRALKRSPFALDLYSLLTYQAFRAAKSGRPIFMTWAQLQAALGTNYSETRDLRRAVQIAMRKLLTVYRGLAMGEREGGLEILPESLPAIASR